MTPQQSLTKKSIVWGPRAGFIYVKKERERERARESGTVASMVTHAIGSEYNALLCIGQVGR